MDAPPAAEGDIPLSMAELEQALAHARLTLPATAEDLEASNEELQATDEALHTISATHQHELAGSGLVLRAPVRYGAQVCGFGAVRAGARNARGHVDS